MATNILKPISFSTYLIHRDSPESLLYDPSVNQTEVVERAIRRSSARLSYLNSMIKYRSNKSKETSYIQSTIGVSSNAEYLMKISIGTPPVKQWATFDTASDLVWTQCEPCINCYQQTQPKFNSHASSSYLLIPRGSQECHRLCDMLRHCENEHMYSKCHYRVNYEDRSSSSGELAVETFKLGNEFVNHMIYGCSNENTGLFHPSTAGIVALGRGPLSLVNQLREKGHGAKFSYCLVHYSKLNSKSKFNFGARARVPGRSTPLTPNPESYFVTLEAISIGHVDIFPFNATKNSFGNNKVGVNSAMMIDTGAFLTYLPANAYQQLENQLRGLIHARPVRYPDSGSGYRLCYTNDAHLRIPMIMFHFARDVDIGFLKENTFFLTRYGLLCLVIAPSDHLTIIGSIIQMDHLVGIDVEKGKVTFRATDC